MDHTRPSIRFAKPSAEERTVVDFTPWHKATPPRPAAAAKAVKQAPEVPAIPVIVEIPVAQETPATPPPTTAPPPPMPVTQVAPATHVRPELPVFAAPPVAQQVARAADVPDAPPSVPALAADPPPLAERLPRLRSDWAAIGATAIFVMLSTFVVHTMSVTYARPSLERTREVRMKGYTAAHDPSLRRRSTVTSR